LTAWGASRENYGTSLLPMSKKTHAAKKTDSADSSTLNSGGAPNALRSLILVLFLLSGATALTYEVVWMRMLTLVFGATTLSVGTVLACYMAGLALGSWFWSRRADETTNPLRFYALLEFGIALAALLTPFLFTLVQIIYRRLFVGGLDDFSVLSVVRFFLCLPSLLLPTFLMGGTLPILARFYTQTMARIGRGAGDLYAVNTLGAVLGTTLAGFWMIPFFGVRGTLHTAVIINLVLAACAYFLSLKAPALESFEVTPTSKNAKPKEQNPAIKTALWGFAISGAAAMILEVTWTRALVQIFGNSTYAFTTMLACFLIGLALGAALCGRFIDRAPQPLFVFAMLQLAIAAWSAAATPLIEYLPDVFLNAFGRWGGDFRTLTIVQFVVCCLLMLPATLALGAVFPTVTKIFAAQSESAGRSIGVPYAANTIGTVFGSLLAGFVLLPQLGIEVSIIIGILLNLGVCAALLRSARQPVPSLTAHPQLVGIAVLLTVLAGARLLVMRLDPRMMSSGVYMYADKFLENPTSLREAVEIKEVLMYREGYGSSLAVIQLKPPPEVLRQMPELQGYIALQANGKTDASTGDLSSQRACAHLPLLLKPQAKRVLVVGLASGCTVGSALLHPIEKLDCVEIEPAMVEAAGYFKQWNHDCLNDARLKIHLQDARNFVAMTDQTYDIITAEPTNPWIAGVNNLFTREYFLDCQKRLNKGGIMAQWFPAYNFNEDELKTALGTFQSVFPHVTVWAFPHIRTDFFAIGSNEPLPFDPALLTARLKGPIQSDMKAMQTTDLWRFSGALLFDEKATKQFTAGARLNTDENPLLEFSTPRHLHDTNSWFTALQAAYTAGKDSRLPVETSQVQAVLQSLGVKAPVMQVRQAFIHARHPDELATSEFGAPVSDIGVLNWEIARPNGSISFQAFPANAQTYPPTLLQWWDDAANTRSSRTRREVGNAALIAESESQMSQPLQAFLKTFEGKAGDGQLLAAQSTPQSAPPLNEYFKAQ
jgi:spermidine synthase